MKRCIQGVEVNKIILSLAVDEAIAGKLFSKGVSHYRDEEDLEKKQSGTKLSSFDGNPGNGAISPMRAPEGIEETFGLRISGAYILERWDARREKEDLSFCLIFEDREEVAPEIAKEEVLSAIESVLTQKYRFMNVYMNGDGSLGMRFALRWWKKPSTFSRLCFDKHAENGYYVEDVVLDIKRKNGSEKGKSNGKEERKTASA